MKHLSQKQKFIVVALVSSIVTFIACGGGHSGTGGSGGGGSTPPTKTSARASIGPIAGMHVFAANTKTSFNFSLVPRAYAQVNTTVTLSQSWNGICNNSPGSLSQNASFFVYGLGQYQSANCSNSWFNDSDGSVGIDNATDGQLVVGNGTITNLVAYTGKGTVLTGANSGKIKLGVVRGAQRLDTGITCTLGIGNDYLKCSSTQTFAALDGDQVVAIALVSPGDHLVNLNVVFTKA